LECKNVFLNFQNVWHICHIPCLNNVIINQRHFVQINSQFSVTSFSQCLYNLIIFLRLPLPCHYHLVQAARLQWDNGSICRRQTCIIVFAWRSIAEIVCHCCSSCHIARSLRYDSMQINNLIKCCKAELQVHVNARVMNRRATWLKTAAI